VCRIGYNIVISCHITSPSTPAPQHPSTSAQYRQCLKAHGAKGYSGKNKKELIMMWEKHVGHVTQPTPSEDEKCALPKGVKTEKTDTYTLDVLKERYVLHRNYIVESKELAKRLGINFRLPSIPEDISENLIKFALRCRHDPTSSWNTKTSGDLLSALEGKQECKCFTSVGPISFTPSSNWDVIYFLDATRWLEDHFILYRVPLQMTSTEWKEIKINKNQTFYAQTQQGRRPRIGWSQLYPQLQAHCEKIAEGSFEGFVDHVPSTSSASSASSAPAPRSIRRPRLAPSIPSVSAELTEQGKCE
jgi:hypothetical protein